MCVIWMHVPQTQTDAQTMTHTQAHTHACAYIVDGLPGILWPSAVCVWVFACVCVADDTPGNFGKFALISQGSWAAIVPEKLKIYQIENLCVAWIIFQIINYSLEWNYCIFKIKLIIFMLYWLIYKVDYIRIFNLFLISKNILKYYYIYDFIITWYIFEHI